MRVYLCNLSKRPTKTGCSGHDIAYLSKSHTSWTSSSNSLLMPWRSCVVRSDSWHPLSSASLTAAPEMWCVSRKGMPAHQRPYSTHLLSLSTESNSGYISLTHAFCMCILHRPAYVGEWTDCACQCLCCVLCTSVEWKCHSAVSL